MSRTTYDQLIAHFRETALLHSAAELLEWDERTKMPVAAGTYRAEQVTLLSGMVHRRRTDPQVGEWLMELEESHEAEDPHGPVGATIRKLRQQFNKLERIPSKLIEELARTSVLGQQVWVEARKHNDYRQFQPLLERTVQLKREQAQATGYDACPYDALLDDYESEQTTQQVARVLSDLRPELVKLVAAIADSGRQAPVEILRRSYPIAVQEGFCRAAATAVGFDFSRGRLDVTHHPFCAEMGPNDCRITTRYDEHFFPSAFFGVLHEVGHGLYDQGLDTRYYGLPPGSFVSLGIHESQSRMWENSVGRGASFWRHFFPRAQHTFPLALSDVTLDDFLFAINDVRPSLIRVEADEATYNLHIIIRFELEQQLVDGCLTVADLPDAWNDKYREYLGIVPPNYALGVLQDVHWSAGLFGYFPTYALGNLYAAQFFAQAEQDLHSLHDDIARGDFRGLLEWLRERIHRLGQRYSAAELVERVTGRPLSQEPLLRYLRDKYTPLYDLP